MKGSQVAALAIGWLAVALSSAVIGSASVTRVGVGLVQPQWQITVSRSVRPDAPLPTGPAAADILNAPALPAPSIVPTTVPVASLRPLASARTSGFPSPALPSSPASDSVWIPTSPATSGTPSTSIGSLVPPSLSSTPTPTSSKTNPGKGPIKHAPNLTTVPSSVPTLVLIS